MSSLSGGSGASLLVEVSTAAAPSVPCVLLLGLVPAHLCLALSQRGLKFMRSRGEDGPSVSKIRITPGYISQVNLLS